MQRRSADAGSFTVTRAGETTQNLTVYDDVFGSATPDADYAALSGEVTILSGETTAAISVGPLADSLAEGTETVIVALLQSPGYNVGPQSSDTVEIADEESGVADVSGNLVIYRPRTPNLQMRRVPEDTEALPGAGIRRNGDDDNRNGVADWNDTNVSPPDSENAGDNDLLSMLITVNQDPTQLQADGIQIELRPTNGAVAVWTDVFKSTAILTQGTAATITQRSRWAGVEWDPGSAETESYLELWAV